MILGEKAFALVPFAIEFIHCANSFFEQPLTLRFPYTKNSFSFVRFGVEMGTHGDRFVTANEISDLGQISF